MRSSRPRTLRGVVAGALFGVVVALAAPLHAQSHTPSADELKAARELFQDAYRDEQDRRFASALEKFQRVAAVKESPSVRYRIAMVLEALGRLRESRDAFRALAVSRSTLSGTDLDVADSAAEHAQALDRRIPRVVVQLERTPPPDARVTIDGAVVPASASPRRFELDPGEHVVSASAPTAFASESRVVLDEGAEVKVTIVLPLRNGKAVAAGGLSAAPPAAPDRTLGIVAVGAGGALLVTGIVLLVVRENDISDINRACAVDCPSENRAALTSKHDDAELFGPLGWGLGIAGLVAAGLGTYLLVRPATAASTSVRSTFRVGTRAVHGGALMNVGALF